MLSVQSLSISASAVEIDIGKTNPRSCAGKNATDRLTDAAIGAGPRDECGAVVESKYVHG
jgi:hypothetical protein